MDFRILYKNKLYLFTIVLTLLAVLFLSIASLWVVLLNLGLLCILAVLLMWIVHWCKCYAKFKKLKKEARAQEKLNPNKYSVSDRINKAKNIYNGTDLILRIVLFISLFLVLFYQMLLSL